MKIPFRISSPFKKLDIRDWMVVVGLAILTSGVWMLSVPYAFIICGGLILSFGIYLSLPRRRR